MRNVGLWCILILAGFGLRGGPAEKNWASDPEWVRARYGAWGGHVAVAVAVFPAKSFAVAVRE